MELAINCECGWTVRAADPEAVVEQAREHLEENHPDVAERLTRDDILSMAEERPAA